MGKPRNRKLARKIASKIEAARAAHCRDYHAGIRLEAGCVVVFQGGLTPLRYQSMVLTNAGTETLWIQFGK